MRIGVSSQDGRIEIAITDDGRGLDVAKIKASAVTHAVLSQEAADGLESRMRFCWFFSQG